MEIPLPPSTVSDRLGALVARGRTIESEGVPFPTDQIRETIELALAEGDVDRATSLLRRAESLYAKASRDWMWIRELLSRADELRELAEKIGVDVTLLEARVGRPRQQLREAPLSAGSLERTAASASLALAILNDTVPKFVVQEAQKLGLSIRIARDRGEDVGLATDAFRRLLSSIQEEQLPITGQRLLEARRAVARIPRAPSVGALPPAEEEEILREARNLARHLHRIKGKARDAQSAARLMTQVRAALSEDRRVGTPEEEIEDLWNEVDRLTKERGAAGIESSAAPPSEGEVAVTPVEVPAEANPPEAPEAEEDEPAPSNRRSRMPMAVGVVPAGRPEDETAAPDPVPPPRRGRGQARRT
jgi:hypothetical protein